jgi:hypothetical protein
MGFLAVAGAVAFAYSVVLPFGYTQRLSLSNWEYLNGGMLAWSVVIGLLMAFVVSVQLQAMRKVVVARSMGSAAGVLAVLASLLPSFLCCTPIIPSILAFVGVSGVGLYATSGTLEHLFAVHQDLFLAASAGLLALMSWWGLRQLAQSPCCRDRCDADDFSAQLRETLVASTCDGPASQRSAPTPQ